GIRVIEDCAQAVGARFRGRPVGTFGDVAAWSFCQDKIISTAGEGGMLTTGDAALWRSAWSYKDHGKSWDTIHSQDHLPGFRWVHESFGTNWRMTEIQAAIGRIQLRRLPEWTAARRRNSEAILEAGRQAGIFRAPLPPVHAEHAWYKAYLFVKPEKLRAGWTRQRILAEITAQGVPCASGSCSEVYLEKAFDGTGLRPAKRLIVAQELGETSVMFMVHPTLSASDLEQTLAAIREIGALAASGASP